MTHDTSKRLKRNNVNVYDLTNASVFQFQCLIAFKISISISFFCELKWPHITVEELHKQLIVCKPVVRRCYIESNLIKPNRIFAVSLTLYCLRLTVLGRMVFVFIIWATSKRQNINLKDKRHWDLFEMFRFDMIEQLCVWFDIAMASLFIIIIV